MNPPSTNEEIAKAKRDRRERRRLARTAMRSVLVGAMGAFVGGVLVVGIQILFTMLNARYPAMVQGLHCDFPARDGEVQAAVDQGAGPAESMLMPVVTAGATVTCRLDAPSADYVAWSLAGGKLSFRSGPLDPTLPCQDQESFASQSPDHLAVSACQKFALAEVGIHRLNVKVIARGMHGLDQGDVLVRAIAPPPPAPPAISELALDAVLALPAQTTNIERKIPIQQSQTEHGLLPTSRDYSLAVYRLADGEVYVSSNFLATSAENASAMKVAYVARTRAVVMSFSLKSGPFVDRWRGWLSGTVLIKLRQDIAGRVIKLDTPKLAVPGRVEIALPEDVGDAKGGTLKLTRGDQAAIDIPLGGEAAVGSALIKAEIQSDKLVLTARPAGK